MNFNELPDSELLLLMKMGNNKAFEVIYTRYWKFIYGFVYQNLGSKEDSEEILHDLMLSLWNNREDSIIENLKVYLFIASRNLVNKSLRNQINIRKFREFQLLNQLNETSSTEDLIFSKEFEQRLNELMLSMPEKTALIFRLSKIEEIPVKKIAAQLALSEKAVEYHVTKSLKFLMRIFASLRR